MDVSPWTVCLDRVKSHVSAIYPDRDCEAIASQLLHAMRLDPSCTLPGPAQALWDQSDIALISYGDSIAEPGVAPLRTLHRFIRDYLGEAISAVHILPFSPWSSDDGFAVIDYRQVNEALGSWEDLERIAASYRLMADLVINHCSARSGWFENFKLDRDPGKDYFICIEPEQDLSAVVRPRTSPLLREVQTHDGLRHVWCTFSHDQVDLDFSNPQVLGEMVSIIRLYLDRGVRIFRLDAVAFLWKEPGTDCINLPQTHELIRLLRCLIEFTAPDAIIITETNIPNRQNLTYFGNGNEAHCIYNFALPPLLVNALITGSCQHLKTWMMSMPPAQPGTTYFNFIASHDGIGLRPAEGLLDAEEMDVLLNTMQRFGGRISWRTLASGRNQAYEINISLFDALQGTADGPDRWQIERFVCAHAIMLALEGIPAFYIHSLIATQNDYERLEHSNHNRHINRHLWQFAELKARLEDPSSHHHKILERLRQIIAVRRNQPAFHPGATQYTLHLGESVFAFWRQSMDRRQSIFALNNMTARPQTVALTELNLIETDDWFDLLDGRSNRRVEETIELAPYQTVWLSNRVGIGAGFAPQSAQGMRT